MLTLIASGPQEISQEGTQGKLKLFKLVPTPLVGAAPSVSLMELNTVTKAVHKGTCFISDSLAVEGSIEGGFTRLDAFSGALPVVYLCAFRDLCLCSVHHEPSKPACDGPLVEALS
jgi:hypothetical protein